MYEIKQAYEDFYVEEIPDYQLKEGPYTYFWMEKRGLNTLEAVKILARKLGTNYKKIGYAGNKDKRAVTKQVCSVYGVGEEKLKGLKIKNIKIEVIGQSNKPVSLGDLKGNKFVITVKNLSGEQIEKMKPLKKILNLFDEQRFSTDNIEIGRSIVKGNFKKAAELLLKNNLVKNRIELHLKNKPNDYVNAVKLVDKKLLMLFVHAYQSYIWNESLKLARKKTKTWPIVGFGTEAKQPEIKKILKKEKLVPRDFIIKQIPEISAEGTEREVYVEVKNFKILEKKKNRVTVSFELPKGSYATMVVKTLLSP